MTYLPEYEKTLDFIENSIGSLKITTKGSHIKAAATLFAIAIDQAQGVKILLGKSAYPSSFALLRIIFESYIRGVWIEKCANEFQVRRFIGDDKVVTKDNKPLYFGDMIIEVERAHDISKYFSEIKNNAWDGLNSLTHSGSIQLHNNFNGKSIVHCYDDDKINEAIQFSTMLACMSFSALVDLASNTDGKEEYKRLLALIEPWAFNK